MQEDNELMSVRLAKLGRLRDRGIDPYPHRFNRTHTSAASAALFEAAEAQAGEAEARTGPVSVAGRIVALRGMGRATFIDLLDGSGRIQVMLRRNVLEEDYGILEDLDLGDWIGVSGEVFRTRAGEVTVEAGSLRVLCKSLRPLPEKWHGLVDVEARYRQRYLDLIANEEVRRTAMLRPRIVSAIRRFMDERGFLEVETPVLVPVAAGAMAHPFVTHHNALNRDLFLRIATELYLKRLIVGGLEKVYEIGKVFRNEGVDQDHSPEFTMMESYESFADYNDVMSMVEELVSGVATQINGSPVVKFGERTIDFTPPWPRLGFREEVIKYSGIDFLDYPDTEDLKGAMRDVGVDVSQQVSRGGLLDKLISAKVEQHLVQPTFLIDYPIEMSPLSKKKADNPILVERFEGYAAGMEFCNAFTELNDPVDQRQRFEEQEDVRAEFEGEETDRLDEDFLVAIEHGMPPTGGLGLGIDRLTMLLSGRQNLREVVLFPQLRTR